jgi:formylglycine-generating enzyme required for sulfatase activity
LDLRIDADQSAGINYGHGVGMFVQQRWFLSYHSPDQVLATRLKEAIERQGGSVFCAPTNMKAGDFWSAQLAQEIAEANAFILLVGEHGVGHWQMLEYDEALDRRVKSPNFPVILVLLEGQAAPGLPFLRRLHWIISPDPASDRDVARLLDAAFGAGTTPGELWRFTSPYRGLLAMKEQDSGYFFGRERETVEVIRALATAPDKMPVLLGNSGVGKSSLAQAGVIAALMRQGWPDASADAGEWPTVFKESRRWCFLTLRPGSEPVRSLVEAFLDTWQFASTDPERVKQLNGWIELLGEGKGAVRDLIDATERRYKELALPEPPAFLLYIDQGEELYVRAEERQRRRFSEILAQGVFDSRVHVIMSLRADFFGALQSDTALFKVHRQINVPPLGEPELLTVVSEPAKLLSVRFETDRLAVDIANRTAEESTREAGALPLLSYLLDDMWRRMQEQGVGILRPPAQSIDLGRVLVDRANAFIATHPDSEDALRRIFTLKLATVREDGEPTRRRAPRSEFSDAEWRLVSELADHPNRLLVTATIGTSETYAEVAHEAIFRRWEKLGEWITAEREFLAWRTGLEVARRSWQTTPDTTKNDALLMGAALAQAQGQILKRRDDLSAADRDFIDASIARARKERWRAQQIQALIYVLLVAIIAVLVAVMNQDYLREQWNWVFTIRPYQVANFDPYVLTAERERALKPLESFRECGTNCPEMIVIPAGRLMMGSPAGEEGRSNNEDDGHGRQHQVTIARPFAVAKFDVRVADWDACVRVGSCPREPLAADPYKLRDEPDRYPVINVSWDDAQAYVAWLSRMTGKTYRLLSEAEWEYAARAGTMTAYFWGDKIGKGNANCLGCGSQWDNRQPSPVGSFKSNAFGLFDMAGNLWVWVEDCYHQNYSGAPADGSAWTEGECRYRVLRGCAWYNDPPLLRSAMRFPYDPNIRVEDIGIRVGRTLVAP